MKHKKLFVTTLFLLIWIGWWCGYAYYYSNPDAHLDTQTEFTQKTALPVVKQDLNSTLSLIGTTKIKNQQKLKFSLPARIVEVNKKTQDRVKKWDVIAKLDTQSVKSQIEIAQIALENAEVKLSKLSGGSDNALEREKAQMDLDDAKKTLENKKANLIYASKETTTKWDESKLAITKAQEEYDAMLQEFKASDATRKRLPQEKEQELSLAKSKLSTLEGDLAKLNKNFDDTLKDKQTDYYDSIEREYFDLKKNVADLSKNITEIDKLLQFKGDQKYVYDYQIYYSVKSSQIKNLSIDAFRKSNLLLSNLQKAYNQNTDTHDLTKLQELLNQEIILYTSVMNASDATLDGLDNSIDAGELTTEIISSFRSVATTLSQDASSKTLTIKDIIPKLKTLKTPDEIKDDLKKELETKQDDVATQSQAVTKMQEEMLFTYSSWALSEKEKQELRKIDDKKTEIAKLQSDYEKLLSNQDFESYSKEKEVKQAELAVKEAQKKVDDFANKTQNDEYSLAQNDVKQAQISLDNEKEKLKNYELVAPFDGLVTRNDYQVADVLGENDERMVVIENPDILEISVMVDQVDITKISKGQKATVHYDGIENGSFEGEVSEVNSTPKDSQDGWATQYEVKILLTTNNHKIFSGMKANVEILLKELLWILTVPYTAVQVDENTWVSTVTVLEKNGKKVKKKVETWYADGNNIEIVSGLKEWEQVLEIDYDANQFKPEDFEGNGM